jgi:2-polyprenyl-6-methoxyphenol hydroxylase-like FAD-dependent oxidoreductase
MQANPEKIDHVIIVGAGMAGLLAAASLSDVARKISLIDKDSIPDSPQFRLGAAQGAHVHTLLGYGVEAMEKLIPGLMSDLYSAGAVKIRRNYDIWFHDVAGPTPIRDVGIITPSVTRPLLEHITRQRVLALPNVNLRDATKMIGLEIDDKDGITGVQVAASDNSESLYADLVVECSGRASQLPTWLTDHGYGEVPSQRLKILMGYTSGFFRMPKDIAENGKACLMLAVPPGYRAAYLTPVDGDMWLATMYGRGRDTAPRDAEGFVAWTKGLPHPIVHDMLIQAEPISEFKTYKIPFGIWYRYDQMEEFPCGLIPMGEAMTSFNPMYGQGMSLAAGQALALRDAAVQGLGSHLSTRYFDGCNTLNSVGWSVMETRDFAYDTTTGERPPDLDARWQAASAIRRLAEVDTEVHSLSVRVTHLLESPSELARPDIVKRANSPLPESNSTSN